MQKYLQGAKFNIYKATPDENGKDTFGTGTGETKYSAKLIGNYTTCLVYTSEIKEHTHDASCYTEEKRLVCTIAETAGHTHTEDCYTMVETGNINCIAPEEEGHVHTEECFEKVKTLTCGQEEVPAHTHTDGCYETAKHCVCGKSEVILHKHDEIHCYSTDDNGNKYLSCGMLEVLSHGPVSYTHLPFTGAGPVR